MKKNYRLACVGAGAKKIYYGKECREGLLKGINKLANAVSVTIGPRGVLGVYGPFLSCFLSSS